MNLTRALTYIFDDNQWLGKVMIAALLTFAAAATMPIFFAGLVIVAILLGYMVEIVENVRTNQPIPLPIWEDYGAFLTKGTPVLTAMVVYNLPLILIFCCLFTVPGLFSSSGAFMIITLCCTLPLIIIYTITTWTMLAVGVGQFARYGQGNVFYRVNFLLESARDGGTYTVQWIFLATVVNVLLGLINTIPIFGWVIGAALTIPIHAHLIGQYARGVERQRRRRAGLE